MPVRRPAFHPEMFIWRQAAAFAEKAIYAPESPAEAGPESWKLPTTLRGKSKTRNSKSHLFLSGSYRWHSLHICASSDPGLRSALFELRGSTLGWNRPACERHDYRACGPSRAKHPGPDYTVPSASSTFHPRLFQLWLTLHFPRTSPAPSAYSSVLHCLYSAIKIK